MLDLESVRCFDAAATHLNFRAASEAVFLSPAAFGERIRRLEDDLGAKLFERTTRRVRLTAAGERLRPYARRLIAEVAGCRAAITDQSANPYELTIGTRFELGLSWLLPALAPLARNEPSRRLHLTFGDSPDLLARVRAQRVDAMVSSARLTTPGLEYVHLHDEDYAFVASRRLMRNQRFSSASDARRFTLIDAEPGLPLFRYFLDALPPEPAFTFARVEYMGTIAAIRQRVLAGAGVAVLPAYFVKSDVSAKRMVRLFPRIATKQDAFRLVWAEGHLAADRLRRLGAELAQLALR